MKLGSIECRESLINYRPKNKLEKIAVEVLLAKRGDFINSVWDLDDSKLDKLQAVIIDIKNIIGIEE